MIIDIGKGIVATRLIAPLSLHALGIVSHAGLREWLPVACGLAAIVGHVYPLWYGFRGGKGVATLVGVVFGVDPMLLVAVLLVWLVMVVLFGFVSLASIVAALSIVVVVPAARMQPHTPLLWFGVAVALLVAFTHRSNLSRMRAGTEPRARRLWLLGRRRAS
jgi:glycerol-3-phosphate acyltransferase PlsY